MTRLRRVSTVPGAASGRAGLAALTGVLVVVLSLSYENFFSVNNGLTIGLSMSAVAIAAIGSAALLIAGNVDLSIGSMYGLLAVLVGEVASGTQSVVLAVATGLIGGLLLGGLNGLLVRLLKISPLIVTIGMLAVYRGFAYIISSGESIYGMPESLTVLGQGGIGRLTIPIMVAAAIFIATGFALVRSKTGLRLYAIGGDARAAELTGVPIRRTMLGLYAFNGMLIGIIATLAVARLESASPNLGQTFEFDVLTAALLGGVAFAGGAGRPIGVFIGVATIGIVNAGLVFAGVSDYWQYVAKGSLLMLALGADQLAQFRRERAMRSASKAAPGAHADRLSTLSDDAREGGASGAPPRDLEVADRPAELGSVVLKATGLSRAYGAVHALEEANIEVRAGEVVGLIGDNGAGKSTLSKILSGAVKPDTGRIELRGQPIALAGPNTAREAGIETVYQELALCPNLSVAHNLVLGAEPTRRWLGLIPVRDDRRARDLASDRLRRLGIELQDENALVQNLSGGERQSIALARAVHDDVAVVLLDEPTAALGVAQTENVIALIRSIARRGAAVILVTHDVEAVLAVAHRVLVLRLGQVVHEGPVQDLSEVELVRLMAGQDLRRHRSRNEPVRGMMPHARA